MDIKHLFKIAVSRGASDLHLVVGLKPSLRVDGELAYLDDEEELTAKDMETMVYSIISASQKTKLNEQRDLDLGMEIGGYRFRINIHYEKNHLGLVARVISDKMPTLEEIQMPKIVYNLLDLKQGLILVTGPTGCGKSTALAAMVDYINTSRFCNIITFEDPIEYIFEPKQSIIIQRQLGSDMNTFAAGLKHALRQDPNVIMVGEMRDLETIATTITLAETGHLVLATLHTYNASQTIDRIIDIFPPHQQAQVRMQLSMTLAGIVSQRLLPSVSGEGRIATREILLNTPAVSNIIRENKIAQLKTVIETGSRQGMVSLDQDLQRLHKDGLVSKEIAQSYMDNPELLEKFKIL